MKRQNSLFKYILMFLFGNTIHNSTAKPTICPDNTFSVFNPHNPLYKANTKKKRSHEKKIFIWLLNRRPTRPTAYTCVTMLGVYLSASEPLSGFDCIVNTRRVVTKYGKMNLIIERYYITKYKYSQPSFWTLYKKYKKSQTEQIIP